MTSKNCLTNLKLTEDKNNQNRIVLTGIALNRREVASMMKNLEGKSDFSDVLLSYSNSIEVESNIRIHQSEVIEYKITCEYNNAY